MAYRAGQPLPDAILNCPDLHEGLELYYRAYMDLDSDRPTGMGVGCIPWTSCFNWATVYELSLDQFDALIYHVNKMDAVYTAHMEKKTGS